MLIVATEDERLSQSLLYRNSLRVLQLAHYYPRKQRQGFDLQFISSYRHVGTGRYPF
jgi:hypothetical protein